MKNKEVTSEEAKRLGEKFKINFKVIPFNEWKFGLNVELEHGNKLSSITNVTRNSLKKTAQIAIAHLLEDPRYYYYLKKMEQKREKYWKKNKKPIIFM